MMKIFCTSDIHGRFGYLQKIIDFVNSRYDIDVVIFAGDIVKDYKWSNLLELAQHQMNDYKRFKSMIMKISNRRVYYIRGNHDVFTPDEGDMNFLPNAYKAGIETYFIPFEKMSIQFYQIDRECTELELGVYLKDIVMGGKYVVAHQPIFGILDEGYSGHNFGSLAIRKKIVADEPRLFICGHVHENFGIKKLNKTTVINCACMKGAVRGVIFDTSSNSYAEVVLN
ncbi:metallophosphoesterase family protein [Clostridium ljungdahlii]|nr:metallophosphoesterase [Clostridium ljungdahlii]